MFLEEKLNNVLEQHKKDKDNFVVAENRSVDLLNVMIDHISERLKDSHSYNQCYQIVKQTDNIWRSFAKKNKLNLDFFRNNYIISRCAKMPGANEYFKITKQELEEYGKN